MEYLNEKVGYQETSILKEGYGIIAKKIMRDKEIDIEAKAIYSYLSSFAGYNWSCFPGKKIMLAELKISEKRFDKYLKQLKNKGYINVYKRRNKNRNDSNLYELVLDIRDFDNSQFDSVQNDNVQNDSSHFVPPNNNSINNNNIYSLVMKKLNDLAKKNYKHTTNKTKSLISARLREGFTEQDFYTVIENKVSEWKGTNMEKFLRPETLFGSKFEGYLNEKPKKTINSKVHKEEKGDPLCKFKEI